MKYTFTTEYTQKSMAVMAKGLRKTMRSKRHRRTEFFSIIVIALAVWLLIPHPGEKFTLTTGNIITILGVLVLIGTLLFEDKINGFFAYKRMIPGMSPATCTFGEENYTSATAVGTTIFNYTAVKAIAESGGYFVFLMDNNHAQLYDKSTLTGGTPRQFAEFITAKTGLAITQI